MPKESTIQHYSSSTTGNIPAAVDLASGEFAINIPDEKVFIKNQAGTVISLSQTKDLSGAFASKNSTVTSANGTTGAVTITGDAGALRVSVSGATTTLTNRLATTSATGVASFNSTRFSVVNGAVDLAAAFQVTGDTVAAVGSVSVSRSGNVATIDNRLASTSVTGVASFNATRFSVVNGAVDLAAAFQVTGQTVVSGGGSQLVSTSGNTVTIDNRLATASLTGVASFDSVSGLSAGSTGHVRLVSIPNTSLANSSVTVSAGTGLGGGGSVALGSSVTLTNLGVVSANGATGAITVTGDGGSQQVSVSGTTTTITNRLATTTATGAASFSSSNFDVAAGAVSLKTGGVPNTALANSSFTLRDEVGATDTISLGDTLTITGGRGVDFLRTGTDTYQVSGVTATSSVLGVASFNATRFSVVNGAVDLTTPYQITGDTVAGVGSVSVSRSGNVATIDNRLASTSVTGVASFNATDFSVASGAVSLQTNIARTTSSVASVNGATAAITITGDAGAQQVSVSGTTTTITNRLATTSATGVASFNTNDFTVSAGSVSLTNVARTNAANTFSGLQTFSSGISGTLTGGSALIPITQDNTTNAQRFLLFAGGAGYTSISIDASSPRVTYNPSTGTLRTSVLEIGQPSPGLTIDSSGIFACDNGFVFGNRTGGNSPGNIYFLSGSEIFFGDVLAETHGTNMGLIGTEGRLFFGASNSLGSLAINRSNTGLTFAAELNHATGRNLRLVYNDTTSISPVGAVEFTTSSSGDLTIKPTGGDVNISGSLTVTGNTTLGDDATDTTTIYGSKVVNEFVFNNGTARTVGLSWANGNVQLLGGTGSGATGMTAIYFTNAPATGSASVTLIVTNGGNMTGNTNFWATNIKWPGGNKPTLSSNGTPDVISFVTPDAGTTIYGFVGGLNFA